MLPFKQKDETINSPMLSKIHKWQQTCYVQLRGKELKEAMSSAD